MKDIQLIKDDYEFINTYHNPFEDLEVIESYDDFISADCYVSGKLIISTVTLQECLDKLRDIGLNVVGFVNSYEELEGL